MATALDLEEVVKPDNAELFELEQEGEVNSPVEQEDLPEKYKGKTAAQIAKMHQDAEKLISRQGGEVGELRHIVDDFIKSQTKKQVQTKEDELEEGDFFVDPKKTVDSAIDRHPAIKEARQFAMEAKREGTLAKLGAKFPDFQDTVEDPAFIDWIKSSKVRTELFLRAENTFDYDSADELLSNWKDKQGVTSKVLSDSAVDRQNQIKSATVGSAGGSATTSKKKYRRSDIIELMQKNPEKYQSMAKEIELAYQEKRVI